MLLPNPLARAEYPLLTFPLLLPSEHRRQVCGAVAWAAGCRLSTFHQANARHCRAPRDGAGYWLGKKAKDTATGDNRLKTKGKGSELTGS